jgi:hypothetical protein
MSGVLKIDIRETEEELKALLRKEKDATRHKNCKFYIGSRPKR